MLVWRNPLRKLFITHKFAKIYNSAGRKNSNRSSHSGTKTHHQYNISPDIGHELVEPASRRKINEMSIRVQ